MQWTKFKDAMLPLIGLLVLSGAGITAMCLGAKYPEVEWLEYIALFIFGSSTGPVHNLLMVAKGTKNGVGKTAVKMLIGGAIGLAVAGSTGCASLQPQSTTEFVYKNGQVCVQHETCVDTGELIDLTGMENTCEQND